MASLGPGVSLEQVVCCLTYSISAGSTERLANCKLAPFWSALGLVCWSYKTLVSLK
jgi:hypothetical protein